MTKEQIQEFTLRTSQSNHSGLILVLFDIHKVYVSDAITAFEEGDIALYSKNIELSKRTLNELMNCMNPKDALALRVLSILRFIYGKLVESGVKKQPSELDRCLNMMDNLRDSFLHLHDIDDEGPVMRNTHQVYAGLTYGRGVLNESIQNVDYSSRGFRA